MRTEFYLEVLKNETIWENGEVNIILKWRLMKQDMRKYTGYGWSAYSPEAGLSKCVATSSDFIND